jgi:hypothetical protein
LTILTREALAIAFVPLILQAWRERGRRRVFDWVVAAAPYALWSFWVRMRVGKFPFLDPATTRRFALAPPFDGWNYTLRHSMGQGQAYGLLIGWLTIGAALVVVFRTGLRAVLLQATLVTCLFIVCYGWSVWEFPSEAMRVMLPAHTLLLLAVLTTYTRIPAAEPPRGRGHGRAAIRRRR